MTQHVFRNFVSTLFFVSFLGLAPTFAQSKTPPKTLPQKGAPTSTTPVAGDTEVLKPSITKSSTFRSSIDEDLTLKSITVMPMTDNVDGIYSKSLTVQLEAIVDDDNQVNRVSWEGKKNINPETLEETPKDVQELLKLHKVDGILATRLTKGAQGITIKVNLFVGRSGQLLVQETLTDYPGFEINDLRNQLALLYQKVRARLPYPGSILSRKGQIVTIDLGTNQGLRDGDFVDAIQVLKLNRHPRFNFLISADKTILGKLKITKAEEHLSFAEITMEREPNAIGAGTKLIPVAFLKYPGIPVAGDGKSAAGLNARGDRDLVMGENPGEWVPRGAPTFGKVGLMLGLGSYSIKNNLAINGTVEGTSTLLTPSLHLDGEMWITKEYFASLNLRQFIFSVDNNHPSGGSPSKLNASTSQYTLQFGYNILLTENFFGPKFQALLGYTKVTGTIDDSTPTALTSMDFNGIAFGFGGYFPLEDAATPLGFGAKFLYYLNPGLAERPVTSGASNNANMSSFSIYGDYQISSYLKAKGELAYDYFSATFSGTGSRASSPGGENATSGSHSMTTLSAGLEYLF